MTNKEAIDFLKTQDPFGNFMGSVDGLLSQAGVFSHVLWTEDDIINAFDQFDMRSEDIDDDLMDEVMQELDYDCFESCESGNDEIYRVVSEIMERVSIKTRDEKEEEKDER